MSPADNPDGGRVSPIDQIDTRGTPTLVVGWRTGSTRVKLRQLLTGDRVREALTQTVVGIVHDLQSREAEVWAPDAATAQETYLRLPLAETGAGLALSRDLETHETLIAA